MFYNVFNNWVPTLPQNVDFTTAADYRKVISLDFMNSKYLDFI